MQLASLHAHLAGRVPAFIEDLRALTAIDCGTHNKGGVDSVGRWVEARCRANGWPVTVHPRTAGGNIVEAIAPGDGTRRVLLLAHMDTVYPDGTATERPMRKEGDRLIGPGTCDMKAGLLAGIHAVEALQALGHTPWAEVVFLFTGDEEIGSPESRALIAERARGCDATLVLEAGRASGAIVGSRKGVQEYHLTIHGRSAHAGVEPEKGRNALLELAHKIIALQALNGEVEGSTVNVGVARAGSATNVIPDLASAQVDVRGTTPEGMAAIDARIRATLATTSVADTTLDVRLKQGFPPMPRTATTDAMIAVAQAAARDLGFEVEAVATGGASDASLVAGIGKPVLDGLGPIGGDAHSPKEWISIASIAPRVAMLGGMIVRIAESGI